MPLERLPEELLVLPLLVVLVLAAVDLVPELEPEPEPEPDLAELDLTEPDLAVEPETRDPVPCDDFLSDFKSLTCEEPCDDRLFEPRLLTLCCCCNSKRSSSS